jgi:hypothetical protein
MRMSITELRELYDNNWDVPDEENLFMNLRKKLHSLAVNMLELYNSNFMVNRYILIRDCQKCQELLHKILANRATRESHERIDFICNFISNKKFLKYAFDSSSAFNRATIADIINDLRSLIYNEVIWA